MKNNKKSDDEINRKLNNDLAEKYQNLANEHRIDAAKFRKLIDPIEAELDEQIAQLERKVCLTKMSLSYYADCSGDFRDDINEATLYGMLDLVNDTLDGLTDLYNSIFPGDVEKGPLSAGCSDSITG